MNVKMAKEVIRKIWRQRRENPPPPGEDVVICLWGGMGIGKSSIVQQVAEEEGIGFIDLRLRLLDPSDLRGFPDKDPEKKMAVWLRPEFIPFEGEGILFLDELNRASIAVLNAALQLIYDRKVGNHELGKGWMIVCAGNRAIDDIGVVQISSALRNRIVDIEVEPDVDSFVEYGIERRISEEIISFIKFRGELLYQSPKGDEQFPSPRGWHRASTLLKVGFDKDLLYELLCGCVGKGPATEFMQYMELRKRIAFDKCIEDILNGKIPEVDKKYLPAIFTSAVLRASKKNVQQLMKVVVALEDGEMAVWLCRLLFLKGFEKEIVKTEEWKKFVEKWSELLSR